MYGQTLLELKVTKWQQDIETETRRLISMGIPPGEAHDRAIGIIHRSRGEKNLKPYAVKGLSVNNIKIPRRNIYTDKSGG